MSIISEIGRKSFKVRIFIYTIYIMLMIGSVSMIYPFAIMIAGTSKSGIDRRETNIIPSFLKDDISFYRKGVESFLNESQHDMRSTYDLNNTRFMNIEPFSKVNHKLVGHWNEFVKNTKFPFYAYELAFTAGSNSRNAQPMLLRRFKDELKKEFNGSVNELNEKLETDFPSWNNLIVRPQLFNERRKTASANPFGAKWREFKSTQELELRIFANPAGFFRTVFLKAQYSKNISVYNQAHKTNYKSWDEVVLTPRYPGKGYTDLQRKDWLEFTRSLLNLYWIRADKAATPAYQEYLKVRYVNNLSRLNKLYGTNYKSFNEIKLVQEIPLKGVVIPDWNSFIQGWADPVSKKEYILPKEMIRIQTTSLRFRDYTMKKYGSLAAVNTALETDYENILQLNPPQRSSNQLYIKKHSSNMKFEFLTRNFIAVFEYIFIQGRAIGNTVIYCSLAIIFSLLINPMGAYALSRYKPRSTYKILLFLMLTMAFPPMVTSIPSFLMLRELSLLNTFAALILPAAANGYSIFLLKGFFDSLPQELYESAELDGASELRIFWQITMSLSKPILAVISLGAFNRAYANFMMAMLICQDQKMWTLMPWLYQLQQTSCDGIIFASLLIAAVPTFMIFIFCQNIIMRGIVVPVEK